MLLGSLIFHVGNSKCIINSEEPDSSSYTAQFLPAFECQWKYITILKTSLAIMNLYLEQRQREKQISLKEQQLSGMLKELFQRARLEKPGQVDPRAATFTLSLLKAMYDRSGTGYIKTRSVAAALIALSRDTLLAKYRGGKCTVLYTTPVFFKQMAEVEMYIFFQVLNSAIVEEKFLSWLRSEPALLLWLSTCYRLSASETVSHQVRCRVCKNFPIRGLRYRCLKCLNFDLCQVCFFTGCLRKPHKRSHPVVEHCVQMSAKASAKHFLCTVRNNLFQDRCRRKEAQRRRALEITEERNMKKQLNKWKDKVQFLHSCQEDRSCKIETTLQSLRASHENLQMELQQIKQDIKVYVFQIKHIGRPDTSVVHSLISLAHGVHCDLACHTILCICYDSGLSPTCRAGCTCAVRCPAHPSYSDSVFMQ
uniref:Dystrotelin n=1 Tax=Cairina moschata TaxID=8855 RepID=A0A8C3GQ95_CAIMO